MKREFTIDAKIEIGQYTFNKLLETGYDLTVKDEVAKEYGITVGTVYKYLREYKERVLEPKPTYEELELFKKLAKNATKSFEIAEKLLISNESELLELIEKYGINTLISKINGYIKSKPDELENINKLEYIKERIKVLNEIRNSQRQKERQEEATEKRTQVHSDLLNNEAKNHLSKVVKSIKEYLESSDYYPNYIFNKNMKSVRNITTYFKKLETSPEPELRKLINDYYEELEKRGKEFAVLACNIDKFIYENNPNIMEFYRLTHMTINKFKTFLRIAVVRKQLSSYVESSINNYFDKYIIGSYSLPNLEEALKINYEYNGVIMSDEDIKNICMELAQNNIPINKNTIIYTFEEKVNGKVNKR